MDAIILTRIDAREFDSIISVYTRFFGKQQALARGTKKMVSKQSTQLEPLSLVEIDIFPGKEIDHVIGVQLVDGFPRIHTSLVKRITAIYALSFVDKLTKAGEPDEQLFSFLYMWLQTLEQIEQYYAVMLDWFIIHFFGFLGFIPILNSCILCKKTDLSDVIWSSEQGGVVCLSCAQQQRIDEQIVCSKEDLQVLTELLSTQNPAFTLDSKQEKRVQRLLFSFVCYHVETRLTDWKKLNKFAYIQDFE